MLTKLSKKAYTVFFDSKQTSEDDRELYEYGLFLLFSQILFILITIALGLLFHCIVEIFIFYISFSAIRGFAGGYHADTETRCEVITTALFLGTAYLISVSNHIIVEIVILGCTLFAVPVIVRFAPLDTPEKPLDAEEKRKYRKISIIILSIIVAASITSLVFKTNLLLIPLCLSLIVESILLVSGKLKGLLLKD